MKKQIIGFITILVMTTSCSSMKEKKRTYTGAGVGAAAGAGVGAILGKKKGAVIGAVAGSAIGSVIGHRMDKQAKELEKIAETKRTEDGIVTKLKSDILFDTGKAELKPAAKTNLKEMANIMKKYPENVLNINGYTDITGTTAFNEQLSEYRAESVKKQLVAAGIPESVINTNGLGPQNPIADNDTTAGRRQNRRVEIEITVDESKVPKDAKSKI
jgi:outer membrane protein OmpA-like peptidoglycan-associated protein